MRNSTRFWSSILILLAALLAWPQDALAIGTPSPIQGPDMDADGTFTITWGSVTGATRYRIKERGDLDDDWYVYQPSWTSNNLPPATYKFRVAACNNSGCGVYTDYHWVVVDPNMPPPPPYEGFDGAYKTYWGDFNSDGRTDIYVGRQRINGLVQPVLPFILEQQADQTFTLKAGDPTFNTSGLLSAPLTLYARDVNADGAYDLMISDIGDHLPGTHDHIVFADDVEHRIPEFFTEMNPQTEKSWGEMRAWASDPDYFDKNALPVVTNHPGSANWFGAVSDPTNLFLVAKIVADCELSGYDCSVSPIDPAICIRVVNVLDAFGNVIGQQTINVCGSAYHIYAWTQGSVTITKDYSVFSQDALDYAAAYASHGLSSVYDLQGADIQVLEWLKISLIPVVERIFGPLFHEDDDEEDPPAENRFCFIKDEDNEFAHAPLPGDSQWDPADPTFHHYDQETGICDPSHPNCTEQIVTDTVLRRFTYPSRNLKPHYTLIDGEWILVYMALPYKLHKASAYHWPFGFITQEYVSDPGGPWDGAIRNVTTPAHLVYPGTITRLQTLPSVEQGWSDNRYFFSHGIGLNRFTDFVHIGIPSPISIALACDNDLYGPDAFRTLDLEAKKFWEDNYGTTGSSLLFQTESQSTGLPEGMTTP
jgi:hypothetical protein